MKKYPEIGALITITKRRGNMWNSALGGKCPNEPVPVSIPFTGMVEKTDSSAINVKGYGFSTSDTEWEYVNNYQIF